MSVTHQVQSTISTEHALLVPCGKFAAQVGLIAALNRVPFKMKTVEHSPGDKLNELLVHILVGGMHINELAKSPHPLIQDQAVAQAWGQKAFASASGISDLLRAASSQSVAALKSEVRHLLEPYRRRILRDLSPSWLVVDFDLTALVVSDQAITYEGADIGYMGELNGLGRGYQFARAQLVGNKDSLVLGGFLHSGRTISPHCLAELVALTEAELGRPRRRVECVEARLSQAQQQLAAIEAEEAKLRQKDKPSAHRHKQLERQREGKEQEIRVLQMRRDELTVDNAVNPNPRRIILRLDGGFGKAEAITWLYEQGYSVIGKVLAHRVGLCLSKEEGLVWEKVSKNGFIAQSKRSKLGSCPYPMRLFACRQERGEQEARWSAMVVTPDLDWETRRVGVFYKGRQVIEAGIKESKGVFASRHLPTRHQAGIELYQELVLLAQNLIRWFRRQFLGGSKLAGAGIKELVQIGGRSRAEIMESQGAIVLIFGEDSPWQGIRLWLKSQISYQLWFPFLEDPFLARPAP
jgi:hypothetical protein